MKYLDEVKTWPIEKKRKFSIALAVFLTILIIGINYGVGLFWKEEKKESPFANKNNPIKELSESFKKNLEIIQPVVDRAFTDKTVWVGTTTEELLNQMSSTSASSSTSTNIVR